MHLSLEGAGKRKGHCPSEVVSVKEERLLSQSFSTVGHFYVGGRFMLKNWKAADSNNDAMKQTHICNTEVLCLINGRIWRHWYPSNPPKRMIPLKLPESPTPPQ